MKSKARLEEATFKTIERFSKILPKFPDGRINYAHSDMAPVINVFVKYQNKILLLKRSNKVREYKGKWNCVGGYLDEVKPLRQKVIEELREELGIKKNNIASIFFGKLFKFRDLKINKKWLVNPVLVELKEKPKIKLDWEHTEYKWIKPKELKNFKVVNKLEKTLKRFYPRIL